MSNFKLTKEDHYLINNGIKSKEKILKEKERDKKKMDEKFSLLDELFYSKKG